MLAQVWEIVGGGPGGARALRRAMRDIPGPGPGEVLVAIRAVSLNYRDVLQLRGAYNPRQELPLIPCSDAAGDVIAVGIGVKSFAVGDRVVNHGLPGWQDGPFRTDRDRIMYGGPDDGTLATHRLFRASTILHVPDHLSFVEAGTLTCAGLTAWSAVVTHGAVRPGETIVIQGTGGVSIFALQFAKLAGARTVVTSSSLEKLQRVKQLGADHVIDYGDAEWPQQIRALTDGRGADAIVEVAGTINDSVRAIRGGGVILSVGVLAASDPTVNLPMIVMRAVRLQGVTLGSLAEMREMLNAIGLAKLRPIVDSVVAFDDADKAFDYYGQTNIFGKVVIELP
ncbi:NAD(P)-dependent alcohol dehydrogenase (plasmid) [Sphingomonas paeninsulae]|uniref:NAD(P)-dependent alcohol dehydrogenase n=1 Tax=Sphingomonas paeninsulae TaxID=2319844 RepID=A0A494TJY8_SPHPE|nr:NAD(P)-dependent alcohol dehydrogenase [Sphingomonas paeninsulae]AYJ85445.1 NAD(P)-dependent alcohol dehydrogenase [Sphingomonas paeninsulae]